MRECFERHFNQRAGVLAIVSLIAGCNRPANTGDPRACQQTYEFGNTGCFEVAGQVVGARGQSLGGVYVIPRPLREANYFNGALQMTDSAGRFRIRVMRMLGNAPVDGSLDTLSVYVVAVDPRSAGVGMPARVLDSVLTIAAVAPIGVIPASGDVRILLAVP